MEIHDTQMLDYPSDLDVHMRTNFSSPKPWATFLESAMDDDVEPLSVDFHAPTYTYEEGSLEVEMEQAYEENAEYEMLDADGSHLAHHPVDVDFVDVQDDDASANQPNIHLSTDPNNPENISEILVQEAHDAVSHTHEPIHHHQEDAGYDADALGEQTRSENNSGRLYDNSSGASIALYDASHRDPATDGSDTHILNEGAPDHEEASEPEPYDAPAEGSREDLVAPVSPRPAEEAYESVAPEYEPSASYEEHHAAIYDESHDDDSSQAAGDDGEQDLSAGGEHEQFEESYYDGDPHEISDGVYIEPPPAVLIDIPSSSDQPESCLFNTPLVAQGSPSTESSHVPIQFTVLLQDKPTLYYEPLSRVFSALREEERIQHIPEFQDGELIVDAYDLELVVSEDNIYAREVTLHDLNDLHDRLNIGGPLRIRLRCDPARFINRFHSLQRQVENITLATLGEDEDNHHHPENQIDDEDHPHDTDNISAGKATLSDHQRPLQAGENEGEGEAEGTNGPHDSLNQPQDDATDQRQDAETDEIRPAEVGDAVDADVHEVSGEGARALETNGNNAYTEPVDESAEERGSLDADAVHPSADADASTRLATETTEYAEIVQSHEEDEVAGDELEDGRVADLDESVLVDESGEALEDDEETLSSNVGTADDVDTTADTTGVELSKADTSDGVDADADADASDGSDSAADVDADAETDEEYASGPHYNDDISPEGVTTSDAPSGVVSSLSTEAQKDDHTAVKKPIESSSELNAAVLASSTILGDDIDEEVWGEFDGDGESDWDEADNEVADSTTVASPASHKRRFDDLDDIDETGPISADGDHSPAADSKRARTA